MPAVAGLVLELACLSLSKGVSALEFANLFRSNNELQVVMVEGQRETWKYELLRSSLRMGSPTGSSPRPGSYRRGRKGDKWDKNGGGSMEPRRSL